MGNTWQLIALLSNSDNKIANRLASMLAESRLREGGETQARQHKEENRGFKDREEMLVKVALTSSMED